MILNDLFEHVSSYQQPFILVIILCLFDLFRRSNEIPAAMTREQSRGRPAHGTCRPQERSAERTVSPARHRRAEEHDSDSRERAASTRRRTACRCSRRISTSACAAGAKRTVVKPGTLTLPAKKLFEIVSALPDTEIRIEEDKGGKSVTIAADRFESRMQTLPASEFPTPPQRWRRRRGHAAGRGAEADDLAHAVCDHERGHAVFPERRATRAAAGLDEHGGDRRPSPGVHQRAASRRARA